MLGDNTGRRLWRLFATALVLLGISIQGGCSGITYENGNGPRGPEKLTIGGFESPFAGADCSRDADE